MRANPRRRQVWLGVLAGMLFPALSPALADAQYFGQNKVQHEQFEFEVLETEHFDIYYYEAEAEAARYVARMAERWRARLAAIIDWDLTGRQPLILYASHPEFEQTNVIPGRIDEGTGGVTEGLRRRIVLPLGATLADTDHVIGHELVHAFQYDILGPRAGAMPLWFMEGMAEYLSVGPRSEQTAMWLRDAAVQDRLPTLDDLSDPRYFPYRFGHGLWAYVGGRWGDGLIGTILRGLAPVGESNGMGGIGPVDAVASAAGLSPEELSNAWHESILAQYSVTPLPEEFDERTEAASLGVLAGARTDDGGLNVGPAVSPDGSKIAFLSGRNRLAVDLYVADTGTGEILRRLTRSSVDPHFQSLQFLQSAGSWAPDNWQLAVGTVQAGRGVIAVFDTESGDLVREYRLDAPGEAFHPAWSPDGSTIVFAGQIGGFTDLFAIDVASGTIRQLTDDPYADLQPSWSPDGAQLVFATDRFTSDVGTLTFGDVRLATIDPASGAIAQVESSLPGALTSPQWTPDGDALLVVGTASGRPDVYRIAVGSGEATQLTDVSTGVTGVTGLSPALSVAREGDQVAFSVFRDSGYEIRRLSGDALLAGVPIDAPAAGDLAALPPADRDTSLVADLIERTPAPPAETEFASREYSPGLSLVAVGQQLGATTGGAFGTYISGGVAFLFSDMLGNHNLSMTLDVNGGVNDIGAQAAYINREHRWNWGVFGDHVPIRSGTIRAGFANVNGDPAYVEITELDRQTYSTLGGLVAYPFSSALRLELSTSAQRIGFDRETRTAVFDRAGQFLFEETTTLDAPEGLSLVQASAALVRDTTAFGATGPILGQRFRFEAAPTVGDLEYVAVTADVRQYAMPVRPVTFAGRALHLARYGGSSEDGRLVPLFLGHSTFVRGYDAGSFSASECTLTAVGSCAEFDRLIGSRAIVLNGEVRIPMLGFGGDLNYGPIPTELFGFVDAGIAWTQDNRPSFFSSDDSQWVRSVGAGARVNLFGYAVAEFNAARALDRGQRGWQFVFNLRPGF